MPRIIEPASRKREGETIDRCAVQMLYEEAVLSPDSEFEPAPLDALSLQAR